MITSYDIQEMSDRTQVAQRLGERLMEYRNSNAILVAIPCGGVPIAYHLSAFLHLPMEIVPCKKIKHPAHAKQTIGSVSLDDVDIHEDCRDLPQDYVSHQVLMHRHNMKAKDQFYHQGHKPMSFSKRVVIVVDDILRTGDTMVSCLKTIRKHHPEKIVVAVPVTTPEAYERIQKEASQIIYIWKESSKLETLYNHFEPVTDEEVQRLFQEARKQMN